MTRVELEHAIRAACDLTNETEVIVFGSQAILGEFPDAPEEIRQSAEADIAPKYAIDKIDLIDGVLGQDSLFHRQHGFYVHGVPIETAVLPVGREIRSVRVQNGNTRQFIGWCIESHEVAFREKDRDFVRALLNHQMVNPKADRTHSEIADGRVDQRASDEMGPQDNTGSEPNGRGSCLTRELSCKRAK